MYKRVIALWGLGIVGVALASLIASSGNDGSLGFVLALPIILSVLFLGFILYRWRR